jgi:exopolysaccharide biosynthesis predicted pyruvyltransferase EpsI
MGFPNVIRLPDPTLLLSHEDYDSVCESTTISHAEYNFFYIIQQKQYEIIKIEKYFRSQLGEEVVSTLSFWKSIMGIEQWIQSIKNAKLVVTNSFHGVVFSIIYHKPFIAVLVEGTLSGMNDRIKTLLEDLDLQNRIMDCFDKERIHSVVNTSIDWGHVDERISLLRAEAGVFLNNNINSMLVKE